MLAGAVLDWGARHEAERALPQEREEARRRQRRLLAIAVGAMTALVLVGALAAYALVQRADARDRARAAKARELTVRSLSALGRDPELALLLAVEASRHEQTPAVEAAVRGALLRSRALAAVVFDQPVLAAVPSVPASSPRRATAACIGRTGRSASSRQRSIRRSSHGRAGSWQDRSAGVRASGRVRESSASRQRAQRRPFDSPSTGRSWRLRALTAAWSSTGWTEGGAQRSDCRAGRPPLQCRAIGWLWRREPRFASSTSIARPWSRCGPRSEPQFLA